MRLGSFGPRSCSWIKDPWSFMQLSSTQKNPSIIFYMIYHWTPWGPQAVLYRYLHHLFQQTKQTLATNWHFHTLQFHNSITVGSLSVAFAGGSVPGEVCSAPSACTAMPSGALFRGNGDMAHGLEVRHWEFTNEMDWESCLDNFSSYFSNSSQFPGQPQPRQEVLLPDFFWWHFYSLKHCPWPRTFNYKSWSEFWSRNTMLEAGCMKLYQVAAYLPDVGFLSLTRHVGAENCGGHSCWESTNQEHHSVEEHRWPGNNEVAVNHFVPGSHCMVKVSFQLAGWGASGRQLEDPAGSPGGSVANSTSEFTWLHFSCWQYLRYLGPIRILPSQSISILSFGPSDAGLLSDFIGQRPQPQMKRSWGWQICPSFFGRRSESEFQ